MIAEAEVAAPALESSLSRTRLFFSGQVGNTSAQRHGWRIATDNIAADVLHVQEDVDLAGGHIAQHRHARKVHPTHFEAEEVPVDGVDVVHVVASGGERAMHL